MLKENDVVYVNDTKRYLVMDSTVHDNQNYLMVCTLEPNEWKLTDDIKIVSYNPETKKMTKVINKTLLTALILEFNQKAGLI